MDELKPCPFCGGKAETKQRGNSIRYFVVKCACCRVEMKGTTAGSATFAWNRRTPTNTGEDTTAGAIRQSGEDAK